MAEKYEVASDNDGGFKVVESDLRARGFADYVARCGTIEETRKVSYALNMVDQVEGGE